MKKLLLAAMLLGLCAPAFAQTVTQTGVSGNEVWAAAQGPGGPGQYLGINTVRNGRALVVVSGSGDVTTTAAGGTLYWHSTAPTTWTITTPSPAFDGELIVLSTDTTLTSKVTLTAASGQTLNTAFTSATLTAVTGVSYQYSATTATWYRIN